MTINSKKIICALDFDDFSRAESFIKAIDYDIVYKVGMEFFYRFGIDGIRKISNTKKINASYSIRANPNHQKWYTSKVESKIISLIENGMIDGFVSDCMFKNVNKINIKKLSHKLNCSDKTAKKFMLQHAPYLLD